MLTTAGYTCRECSTGYDALHMLKSRGPFQLVLYDISMKDLDGITFLERLKQPLPDVCLVVVASVCETSAALAAIRNGAYDYLLKNFDREQLLATVGRALEHHRLKEENRAHRETLESLVKMRTGQLQNAMASLERSYDFTLDALGDALDLKDGMTMGHAHRVTAYSIALAKAIGLSRERIPVIARGAFLHDIGKMAIPDSILRKPGGLHREELILMQEHPYRGYQIVRKIPFLAGEAAEIVYAHHERYDGTGYPRGLKGEEIPLGARIVAVANTMDSITSDLPYRDAASFRVAREEVEAWSGRQFDPEIVKVFLGIPERLWEDLRRETGGGNRN